MAHATLERRYRAVLLVLAAEIVVLIASGMYLTFRYFPRGGGGPLHTPDVIRGLHRICAWALLPTAVLLLILVLLRAWPSGWARLSRPMFAERGAAGGLIVLSVLGLWTGLRLPWDQLAVKAVRVDSRYAGYSFLWHHDVRFVLAALREETTAELLHRLLLHVLVSGLGSAALLVAVWIPNRRRLRGFDHDRGSTPNADEMIEEPAAYLD